VIGSQQPLAVNETRSERIHSSPNEFDVEFPDHVQAIFQGNCGPKKSKAVADVRYLIIEPLSKGEEITIHVKGNILVDPGVRCLERGFNKDLTYILKG
jgi:hypothetical protein